MEDKLKPVFRMMASFLSPLKSVNTKTHKVSSGKKHTHLYLLGVFHYHVHLMACEGQLSRALT